MTKENTIGIWSPKGGCGKSFIAASLGVCLDKKGVVTGLLEAHRQHSSLPNVLNVDIPINKGLKEMIYEDSTNIKDFFSNDVKRYKNLSIMGLSKENKIDDLHRLSEKQIEDLYIKCKEAFQVLIIELPSSYVEFTSYIGWFFVKRLLVVVDNDINSIMALRKYVFLFKELGIDINNIYLIVNKDMGAIELKAIELLTGLKIGTVVPFSKRVISDMNNGQTIFKTKGTFGDFRIKKAIENLARVVMLEDMKDEISTS